MFQVLFGVRMVALKNRYAPIIKVHVYPFFHGESRKTTSSSKKKTHIFTEVDRATLRHQKVGGSPFTGVWSIIYDRRPTLIFDFF